MIMLFYNAILPIKTNEDFDVTVGYENNIFSLHLSIISLQHFRSLHLIYWQVQLAAESSKTLQKSEMKLVIISISVVHFFESK